MIEAYVTNLGKYNEGELYSELLRLPATQDEVKAVLSKIGVDGFMYEEFFIADYKTSVEGLNECLGEYESVDELNYLAALLSDLDKWELEKFEAALELGDNSGSVKELINLAQNLDCYDFFPDVNDHDDLGRYLIDEMCCLEIPENIQPYFDYEAYGRDFSINDGGELVNGGYIMPCYGSFPEHYGGRDDIPDEHRIFAYPDPPEKMPMRQQLEMFGKMVSSALVPDRPMPVREERA